jgi:hypothetical protein
VLSLPAGPQGWRARRLAKVTTSIVVTLATPRTQLAAIKAGECDHPGRDHEVPHSGHLAFTWRWKCPAMDVEGRALGPARTNFNDYVGTVAADDAEAVLDRPSLYELAQIDRDRYTILGIELKVVDGPTKATVYAFDRLEHSVARLDEIVELGLSRGEIPVLRFDIPEMDVGDFIRHAFRLISVRLVKQNLSDQVLMVTEPSSVQAEARGTEPL